MDNKDLVSIIDQRVLSVERSIAHYSDLDELIQNAASGGNHDDTFTLGQDFGFLEGKLEAYKGILTIISHEN